MTTFEPRPEDALAFLDQVHPNRRRILVSINPLAPKGAEEILTRTFDHEDRDGVVKFMLGAFKKRWNIYYTVNETVGAMSKKPSRVDIARIHYLHVDVDPRKPDADERTDMPTFLAKERARILALFDEKLPAGIPAPTVVVPSGGGYNALWKLSQPLDIAGQTDKERLESAEAWKHYNRQLERKFGADNCHNIDRVLRLPGSVNFPNHVKIANGRTEPTMAETGTWHDFRVYPISEFTPAPSGREQPSGAPPKMKAPTGPIKRIEDIETLDLSKLNDPHIENLVRRVIVDGRDAQNPERFVHEGKFDRSRAVYFVTKRLAQAGVPHDVKWSIFTDPRFGISESILEKGSAMERQALRTLERGEEGVEGDELAELNDRHAVIASFGGDCVVVQEEQVGLVKRTRLTVSSFDSIRRRYCNRRVLIGEKLNTKTKEKEPIYVELGDWWLKHPMRRQFDHLVFEPGKETPGMYNLWQGFAVEAIEGDCSLFLAHMRYVVCDGNEAYFEYLLNWMAYAVQHPDEPGHVAVVFRGEPGAGKGMVAREFGKLFGRHYMQVTNSGHLVGQFNDHLRDCVLLFLDEAFFAGDVKNKSILKALVTEPEIMIEKKGVDAVLSRNHLHIMMASNERWVVPVDAGDRRFFVLDVPPHRQGMAHEEYWTALVKQMESGGREALLHLLKNRDLEKFQPRTYPKTKALAEQKILSLTNLQEWWYGKLISGQLHPSQTNWTDQVICERLQNEYMAYTGKLRSARAANATELGRFFEKMAPGVKAKKATIRDPGPDVPAGGRYRVYVFPSLDVCRKKWTAEFGETDWPDDDVEESEPPPSGF